MGECAASESTLQDRVDLGKDTAQSVSGEGAFASDVVIVARRYLQRGKCFTVAIYRR